jgi:hypothetical protein
LRSGDAVKSNYGGFFSHSEKQCGALRRDFIVGLFTRVLTTMIKSLQLTTQPDLAQLRSLKKF